MKTDLLELLRRTKTIQRLCLENGNNNALGVDDDFQRFDRGRLLCARFDGRSHGCQTICVRQIIAESREFVDDQGGYCGTIAINKPLDKRMMERGQHLSLSLNWHRFDSCKRVGVTRQNIR